MRPDRESYAAQDAAVDLARADAVAALASLEVRATDARRVLARRGRQPSPTDVLAEVHAAHRAVERAEEALDLALLDRATAAGADA